MKRMTEAQTGSIILPDGAFLGVVKQAWRRREVEKGQQACAYSIWNL